MNLSSTVILNTSGDVTVSWTDDEHEHMLKVIQQKLDDGYVFFEVERTKRFFDLISTSRKKYIKNASELSGKQVTIKNLRDIDDRELADVLVSGVGAVTSTPSENKELKTIRPVRDAHKIVNRHTVMMRQVAGG
jgi:hypothetical protein